MPSRESNLFTPEGIMMLTIFGLIDMTGWLLLILDLILGLGEFLFPLLSGFGYFLLFCWQTTRNIGSGLMEDSDDDKNAVKPTQGHSGFISRHWWKLIVEALPFLSNICPTFTIIVFQELTR